MKVANATANGKLWFIFNKFKATPHNPTKKQRLVYKLKTIMQLPKISFTRQLELSCQKFSVSQNQIRQSEHNIQF